jgi:hypothetical protein
MIGQDSVMAGSGTPGLLYDAPGFPLTITSRGSYKLTGNLRVPPGTSGVVIAVSGVTLDLNGFSIATQGLCERLDATGSVFCESGKMGDVGVKFHEGGSVVRNGRIAGFRTGVRYKQADHLADLLIEHNETGVTTEPHMGASTLIESVRVQLSQWTGIHGYNALVRNSSSSMNGHDGFWLGRSLLIDSVASRNKGAGVRSENGARLAAGRNAAWNNMQGDFVDAVSLGQNVNTVFHVH